MSFDELKQRQEELETQLAHHAAKAERLGVQGLHELAAREEDQWKQVSEEYVRVGNQIEDLERVPTEAAATTQEWEDYCRAHRAGHVI